MDLSIGVTEPRQSAVVDLTHAESMTGNWRWQASLTYVSANHYHPIRQNAQWALQGLVLRGAGPLEFGAGLALLDHRDWWNGSRLNVCLQASYRLPRRPLTISWRHWSNAGLAEPNWGTDMLLIGWTFH